MNNQEYKKQIVVFDFDGVIADTFDFCYKVSCISNPDLTEDVYRSYFEGNINDSVKVKKEDSQVFDFFAHYTPHLLKKSPIDGIPEVIKNLAEKYQLVIISSTNSAPIKQWLTIYDLREYFMEIMGNDVSKSKVEKFSMLLEKTGLPATDLVFITDTLGDVREGKKVSIESIGVQWGFHSLEKILSGNPYAIVERPENIFEVVSKYFNK